MGVVLGMVLGGVVGLVWAFRVFLVLGADVRPHPPTHAHACPLLPTPAHPHQVPIWIRGQGAGKQQLRLLLRYSPAEVAGAGAGAGEGAAATGAGATAAPPVSSAQCSRFVRFSLEVCVLPCMDMSAEIVPRPSAAGEAGGYDAGEYLLSLVLTNFRSDGAPHERSLMIHDVCGVSSAWTIEPINVNGVGVGDGNGNGEAALGTPGAPLVKLSWQECIILTFRVRPAVSNILTSFMKS